MVRRKGLLDEFPYVRRIRGMILVRTEVAGRVRQLLEDLGAEVRARTVVLSKEDREALTDARRTRPG